MRHFPIAAAALFLTAAPAPAQDVAIGPVDTLRNWAAATCLSEIAAGKADRDDARLSAEAYAQMGHMSAGDKAALLPLVRRFATRSAGGDAIPIHAKSCIDLLYSRELRDLAAARAVPR